MNKGLECGISYYIKEKNQIRSDIQLGYICIQSENQCYWCSADEGTGADRSRFTPMCTWMANVPETITAAPEIIQLKR